MKSMLMVSTVILDPKYWLGGLLRGGGGLGLANVRYGDAFDPSGISPGYLFRYSSLYLLSFPPGTLASSMNSG